MSIFTTPRPPAPTTVEPLAAGLILGIASGLARTGTLWVGWVRHDQATRHPVRVLTHDRYEAWLIGWPADHRTTPHDHGGSVGALAVVDGDLIERTAGADGTSYQRHLRPGDAIALPAGVVHDVGTLATRPATSVHVYSPPLSTMTFYDDSSGLPAHVLDVDGWDRTRT